jgi:hypothetical protein
MPKPIDLTPWAPKRREVEHPDGTVSIFVWAPTEPAKVETILTTDQYRRYRQWREGGVMIQMLLPELSDSQREKLMTGLDDEAFARDVRPED